MYLGTRLEKSEYNSERYNEINHYCFWDSNNTEFLNEYDDYYLVEDHYVIPPRVIRGSIRPNREVECFKVINRGKLWYDTLTSEQLEELNEWYQAWLDAPKTEVIPKKPEWIK